MTLSSFVRAAVSTVVLLVALPAFAAADYLLEIDGIKGESSDTTFPESLEVESWSFGVSSTNSPTGGGAGKATFKEFTITKRMDKSSPLLYLSCASGTHIANAVLHCRKTSNTGQVEYYKVTMTDIVISSVQTSGGPGGLPTESFSLNYAKIEWRYTPDSRDGTPAQPVVAGWDLATNKKL
jgi:type VI secretion system secreted protein Hcp